MALTTKRAVSRSTAEKAGRARIRTAKVGKKTKTAGKGKAHSAVDSERADIIARVTDWAGGPLQALAWYREVKIAALGQKTAERLVKTGHAAAVRAYLDHIAVGGFA